MSLYKEIKLVYEGEKDCVHIFGMPCKRRSMITFQALDCDLKRIIEEMKCEQITFISPYFDDENLDYLNHSGAGIRDLKAKVSDESVELILDEESVTEGQLAVYNLELTIGDSVEINAVVQMYDKTAQTPVIIWNISTDEEDVEGAISLSSQTGESNTITAAKAGKTRIYFCPSTSSPVVGINITVSEPIEP